MEGRPEFGKRQAGVDRTRAAVLAAARELVASGGSASLTVGAVARKAGVSRLTIYNRFGSRSGLLRAVAGEAHGRTVPSAANGVAKDPVDELRDRITAACSVWSSEPALFRALAAASSGGESSALKDRSLAERLAVADQLRPGCSLKEAEDVIGVLTSFAVFDRLHQDGRRSSAAVAEMLMRLAGAILNPAA
ncbi:MAG TPA: TetR/AcrR family transcriptional regulator [Candidatus Dormibacteraeota bacterium]|nr:TetR/AcrR family transcriptional regulator [Candidatus Dormibacteraeota bacterium]